MTNDHQMLRRRSGLDKGHKCGEYTCREVSFGGGDVEGEGDTVRREVYLRRGGRGGSSGTKLHVEGREDGECFSLSRT